MHVFEFNSVGRVLFGRGQFERLGEVVPALGAAALIVYNGDEPGRGGGVDRAVELLSAAGVRHALLRQKGEPRVEDVDRGVQFAKERGCDVVVGLGGGSAIDAAKAVA